MAAQCCNWSRQVEVSCYIVEPVLREQLKQCSGLDLCMRYSLRLRLKERHTILKTMYVVAAQEMEASVSVLVLWGPALPVSVMGTYPFYE